MVSGKTGSGFEYELNEKMLNDWEVVTILDSLSKRTASMVDINTLFTTLLADEGFEKLKAHVREKNEGVVDVKAMMAELQDILSYSKAKN